MSCSARMSSGSLFHADGPAWEKARSPNLVMGGAADTAGTAAAVRRLREVRQDKVLPYHILVKKILKHIGDLVLLI